MKKQSKGTVLSLDGKRTVSLEEFDRIADSGSDEIDEFLDWSKAKRGGARREPRATGWAGRAGVAAGPSVFPLCPGVASGRLAAPCPHRHRFPGTSSNPA